MPSIFGLASLGIGILLVIKCANLPVMVLATLLGALIGEFCYLEKGINSAVSKAKNLITRRAKRNTAITSRLFKTMSPSLFCFAPAAPGFSVRCRKG
jgi:uncharacterized membrane protein YqgA involved in biofilm formation